MDEKRRQFIAGMAAIAGAAALDGFGLLRASSANQSPAKTPAARPSRDIKDYPHITDVIPSRDMKRYFPTIVDACYAPKGDYISKVPFIIELEVSKIWSESLFEWDALSNVGAGGLQQLMEGTARDFGLTVAKSPEITKLNSAISEYKKLRTEIISRRQELHKLVETGSDKIAGARLVKLNKLRVDLASLYTKRSAAYRKLRAEKANYVGKINSLTAKQREQFDARFVPELLIPKGVEHIVRDIMECKDFFGGSVEMNTWRGVAAYNSGLGTTKKWGGLPYIEETVHFTRKVLSDLTKTLELKHAYATKDAALIAETKRRIRLKSAYSVYVVKRGDTFDEILHEQVMDKHKLQYNKALEYIKDGKGNKVDPKKMSRIFPNQKFRIYAP
ncbi:hypothetical protein ACFL6S_22205 [Candidatus Poribacteria bacterium]